MPKPGKANFLRVNFNADHVTIQTNGSQSAQRVNFDQLPDLIEQLQRGASSMADEMKAKGMALIEAAAKLKAAKGE